MYRTAALPVLAGLADIDRRCQSQLLQQLVHNVFLHADILFSVMEKLPATSYVRLVDMWLIFGQLLPFIQVVFTLTLPCIDVNMQPML